ncbi:ocr-like anti-restriction [Bacillus phage Mgbh1]|uniref:Uncharacterized protein n=1 Tax=Bacillus phage Mgbh1 TaxID=1796993 RepID=A0A142F1K7_9CAUD|nr:ocr-like anti-restriction [Bacillus phage Mgbh1]AMQ66664.1 hypothetical protein [Bacillus phage Mgbh1]
MLKAKTYDYELLIGDEDSILDYFFTNYAKEDVYLCDAMQEQADYYVPIYNSDVWANVDVVQEYVERVIDEGLTAGGSADLTTVFRFGYYEYYYALLDNNLDALCYNYIVDEVNKYLLTLNADELEKVDMEAIAERIETYTDGIDRDIMLSHVDDYANHIIDNITFLIKFKYKGETLGMKKSTHVKNIKSDLECLQRKQLDLNLNEAAMRDIELCISACEKEERDTILTFYHGQTRCDELYTLIDDYLLKRKGDDNNA